MKGSQELSGTPNHWCPLKSIAGTNGRRIAVQIGDVALQHKLEVLWRFPFLEGLEASEAQRYKWGRTAVQIGSVPPVLFRQVVRVGGS